MAPFTKENFTCHFISENYCFRALRSKICCSRAFCVRDDHWWPPQFLHQAFLVYKMLWSGGLGFYPRWVWDSKNSGPSSALTSHGTLIFLWMIHCSHVTLCISPWMELTWTHTCTNYMLLKLVVVIRACWSWWAHTCIWRSKSCHCQSPPLLGTSLL